MPEQRECRSLRLEGPGGVSVGPRPAKGNRPSFAGAAPPEEVEQLSELCAELRRLGARIGTGVLGAKMELELVNDEPVTIVLDSWRPRFPATQRQDEATDAAPQRSPSRCAVPGR